MTPYHHRYPLGCIELFLDLVLRAAASLRCAGQAIEIMLAEWELPYACPAWSTGRWWLLRLGYYKLTRPKTQADDWVWIIDHTVQVGPEKCLVILGVRLSGVASETCSLSHEVMEPIELLPVKQSNGEVVYQQLEKAIHKTGIPREIISDFGPDLKVGIEKFCRDHPQTSWVYDVKHKTAAVLKRELEHDANWLEFVRLANQMAKRVLQTEWAALAPPNQRAKARYLNVDRLVEWGQSMLGLLEQPQLQREQGWKPERVREQLGWLTDFRACLAEWGQLFKIVSVTESLIRHQGLYAGVELKLKRQLQGLAQTPLTRQVRADLVTFVMQEAAKAQPDEYLLGSSEIIESVLGKMKRLEQDQATSGFTSLTLGLCAMLATTTQEVIQQALETVSTQQVLDWCRETLGASVQSKRRALSAALEEAEQKRDQILPAT